MSRIGELLRKEETVLPGRHAGWPLNEKAHYTETQLRLTANFNNSTQVQCCAAGWIEGFGVVLGGFRARCASDTVWRGC